MSTPGDQLSAGADWILEFGEYAEVLDQSARSGRQTAAPARLCKPGSLPRAPLRSVGRQVLACCLIPLLLLRAQAEQVDPLTESGTLPSIPVWREAKLAR